MIKRRTVSALVEVTIEADTTATFEDDDLADLIRDAVNDAIHDDIPYYIEPIVITVTRSSE